jgi:hypothetical protein
MRSIAAISFAAALVAFAPASKVALENSAKAPRRSIMGGLPGKA